MNSHQTTIKDIAKTLGISPSTVSRALKDHPDISVKTKRKVQELAKELKYQPNEIALSLKNQRTKVIGIIIPEIIHHFFSSIISGISDVAYKNGYNIMITQSNESYEREVQDVHMLISSRAAGVLASVAKTTQDFEHFRRLEQSGIPVVFFDRVCPEMDTDRVIVDDYRGAYMATEHLLLQGKKQLIHLGASQHMLIGQNRKNGFKDALVGSGFRFEESMFFKCDTFEEGIEMTAKILASGQKVDGIFAVNDATAIGAMRSVKKAGLRIPEDIAIVGFTNGLISQVTDPGLTTIEQHGFEMGKSAVELLLRRIKSNNENIKTETVILQPELVVRESTKS
ncbi:MAG TPA: LacI family transcriptional regulator [Bacteroidales bacterium]|nr:LacI family transcriptional regulator [Bacteroidales bacterium]